MAVGIIFDLDQTLVDSQIAAVHRDKRPRPDWDAVDKVIHQFTVYSGIPAVLELLAGRDVPIAIVTSSPERYCVKVIKHHQINISRTVCWSYSLPKKPHPGPILEGIKLLGLPAADVWSIGDLPKDITATNKAGAHSVAAVWGTHDRNALIASGPETVCETVQELHGFLDKLTA